MTIEEQARLVEKRFPGTTFKFTETFGHPAVHFSLSLRPTPTSATYRVFFCVWAHYCARVMVVEPKPVKEVDGQPTPHLMSDNTLCLYDSNKRQWSASDSVARSIVAWTERWLFHYEHWVEYGEWCGDVEQATEPKLAAPDAVKIGDAQ